MIYRIDVGACPDLCRDGETADPHARAVRQQIAELGIDVGQIETFRVFFLDTDAPRSQVDHLRRELLADPIVEHAEVVTSAPSVGAGSWLEVHLKPGVMDPVAASTETAIRDFGIPVRQVRTGRAYRFERSVPAERLKELAGRVLANGVIESVHLEAVLPSAFPEARAAPAGVRHVPLRDLSDDQLRKLSREGHLFLSLAEMQAIQAWFRAAGREPTDAELETLAQTWSEHCVHKTLKSAVEVCDASGRVVRKYGNLIKETIFQATSELIRREATPFCLSVFKDNAGVIAFDDADAVCFKVETHNRPSAIEPYGGSATGVGGVIRDVLGTGLAAKPIANTDVFCVAFPERTGRPQGSVARPLPRGVIHPKRILQQVVAGVRDYGNRMGIPTVNGAVYFDDRYVGNPLVFCGCVGMLPRDRIEKAAREGDLVVVMGGRTGRDGIHGATFSSAELTDTHADEFSHAVQIGNAITEKKLADVVLQARDQGLFSAITDCGAGGLSSAVGEMGAELGAEVDLEKVPLKYSGLRYDEIWISEAQERMVLSVSPDKVNALLKLAAGEDVEATVIGRFGTADAELILRHAGNEVGRLSMGFLHDGIPMPTRRAVVAAAPIPPARPAGTADRVAARSRLLALLAHPNIASKHWIIRQYDHEVQGGSVVKGLLGPRQQGPADGAVLRPKSGSMRGVALACGLAPHVNDPYAMAIASIDEAVRNAVCVGADPARLAMLDNFCWPGTDDERAMGALVRACEACRDAALAYGVPFISGKDSLHNQFTVSETGEIIRIPYTLLISTIGVLEDVRRCVTSDLKRAGNSLWLVRPKGLADGSIHAARSVEELAALPVVHRAVAGAIGRGLVRSCHDASDGGVLVAAAEMCIGSGLGLGLLDPRPRDPDWLFEERLGEYLVELPKNRFAEAREALDRDGVELIALGELSDAPRLMLSDVAGAVMEVSVEEMTAAWRGPLDW